MSHTNHRRQDKPPKRLRALPEGGRRDCTGMATHGRRWMHARRKGQRRFWRTLRRQGKVSPVLASWAPGLAATGEAKQPDLEGTTQTKNVSQLGRLGRVRTWRLRHKATS